MSYQSELSQLIVTTDDVASALFAKINTDATLQGSTYLNGTGRIFKWESPINAVLPRIVISVKPLFVSEYTRESIFNGYINIRIRNINDSRLPDSQRFQAIAKRCINLIDGHNTLTLSGFQFFDSIYKFISNIILSDVSTEESFQEITFLINVRSL